MMKILNRFTGLCLAVSFLLLIQSCGSDEGGAPSAGLTMKIDGKSYALNNSVAAYVPITRNVDMLYGDQNWQLR